MNKNIYEILLDTVSEAKKCDNLAQTMALIHLTVIDLLENKIIVDDPNRTEQRAKAVLEHCVVTYGKEISRFSAIDRDGVEFRCGNVLYDGKIFFVVSANGKIIECLPIEN